MGGVTAVFLALIIVGLPVIFLMLLANRFFRFRERKLEVEALNAAEKAAQYLDLRPEEQIRKAIPVERVQKAVPTERARKTVPVDRVALTNASRP